jgi:hypothetical protein
MKLEKRQEPTTSRPSLAPWKQVEVQVPPWAMGGPLWKKNESHRLCLAVYLCRCSLSSSRKTLRTGVPPHGKARPAERWTLWPQVPTRDLIMLLVTCGNPEQGRWKGAEGEKSEGGFVLPTRPQV